MTKIVGALVIALFVIGLFALLMALPVMWLWNSCVAPLGVHAIGFCQALGLNLLAGIFFRSNVTVSK